ARVPRAGRPRLSAPVHVVSGSPNLVGDGLLGPLERLVGACSRIVERVDVGLDAPPATHPAAAEVLSVRREVLAHSEVERTAVWQGLDFLEDPLAVSPRAHHQRAMAILE